MSNFKKVWKLNKTFNMTQTSSDSIDWDIIKAQLDTITQEYEELVKAYNEKNWEQLKDATGDILVTAYGMGYRGNLDADKLMANISKSNFSKLCYTIEDATATVSYYQSIGCVTHIEETSMDGTLVWAVKSSKNQTYIEDGEEKTIPNGKFLKSIKWHEPDLDVEYNENNRR